MKIYETLGPHVGFGPFMGVRAGCARRYADIYGGARLSVGGEAKILGYGVRYEIPAWERQWNIRRFKLHPEADESVGFVTGLRVAGPTIDRLTLDWNAPRNDCGLAGYNVYRDGRLIAEGIATTTFVDGGLAPDREYCYEVSAVGASGEETTPGNNEVCGTTEELEAAMPEPPVNVAAEALSSSMISVTWDAPDDAGGITGYVVYQHSGPDVFAIDSVASATPEVEVGGLQPDSEYCFSVRSVSAAGPSDGSSRVCATTLNESAATVTLTWGKEPRDLASHLYGPDGQGGTFHVYWRDMNVFVGDTLINHDVDDTDGYGPEVITIPRFPFPGTYHYLAEHWAGSSTISASPARVELNLDGESYIFSAEMASGSDEGQGSVWAVFKIEVDQNFMIEVISVQDFQDRLLDSDTPS